MRRIISALAVLIFVIPGVSVLSHVERTSWAQTRNVRSGVARPSSSAPQSTSTTRTHATVTGSPAPTRTPTSQPSATHIATTTKTPTPRPLATATHTPNPTPTLAPARGPVQVGAAQFSLFTINPQFTRQDVSFSLSAPARVRVRIAHPSDTHHVRTMDLGVQPAGTVTLAWDGRDNAHRLVPQGDYTYTIAATNATGTVASESYTMLGVTYKRIVISLSKQQLWAFDGSHYVMSSLVTTGNPALPTPTGAFPILGAYSPFTFVSPWPPGSAYYYAPSYTNYALLFDNRGYYVHDAPWRGHFGPGSNATTGTPGQNYTGSHGCVNVPLTMMQPLFQWATIGTVVEVVR